MKHLRYEKLGDEFWIVDPELGIDVHAKVGSVEKGYFLSGEKRLEICRKGKELHGPSLFFSEEGRLLSETWYVEGKKMGEVKRYYLHGELYSIERFFQGKPHKVHEFFYPDGTIKTLIHYDMGLFHGEVKLFWPNGRLKRRSLFEKGELCGKEEFFHEEELLIDA